jgi:hypothetical protein
MGWIYWTSLPGSAGSSWEPRLNLLDSLAWFFLSAWSECLAEPTLILSLVPPTELVVLVDFVFPWGIEYPVVFLPQGLYTLWCLQMA